MLHNKELEEIVANANLEFNNADVKNEMLKLTEKFLEWEFKIDVFKNIK